MVTVIITDSVFRDLEKKFSNHDANEIIDLMESLEENPKKGKEVGVIGKTVIKEIKYNSFRFYFITDGYSVKFLRVDELQDLIIKFVRMSGKKDQKQVIEEIKNVLRKIGAEGF